MRYSTEPTDQILLKGYGFLSFTKNIGKKSRNLSTKYSQKLFDHGKQSVTDARKSDLKKQFRKQQKQLVIWLVIKLLIKLQKFKKL